MRPLISALVLAVLAGCSVSPAPLMTIPAGHPGHADSGETPYVPPPNVFKQDVPSGKAEAGKPYPLDVCVVGGEKLGSMGDPVILKHEGREVRLCCPGCVDKFKADPAKYLKKLDEAEKKSPKHDGHEGH